MTPRSKCWVHGHASNPRMIRPASGTYKSWRGLCSRCTNPKNPDFHRYGGRGITVCERWRKFANFLADMGERPDGLTIDRIDNDGNYEPGNCRWATPREQHLNRSAVKLSVEIAAEIRRSAGSVSQAFQARKYGVHPSLISRIISGRTWPP